MRDEPRTSRGEWMHPAAGFHSYPPRRAPRFPGPRRTCPRCGLVSETSAACCPVCDTRFHTGRLRRMLRAFRSS